MKLEAMGFRQAAGAAIIIASSCGVFACNAAVANGWTPLFTGPPSSSWTIAGEAALDPEKEGALVATPGRGVLISSKRGGKRERNLVSIEMYRDLELRLEFMLAEGSNAGVKMHSLYELQLYDSHGSDEPTALDCGGIYPRAVREPNYHHIDEGTPPLTNAAKPAGHWQSVYIRFRGPRFDASGNKVESAVFEEVRINDLVVQEQAVVDFPTGAYWRLPESTSGPVYLQGDHGPVAYRNVMARALE